MRAEDSQSEHVREAICICFYSALPGFLFQGCLSWSAKALYTYQIHLYLEVLIHQQFQKSLVLLSSSHIYDPPVEYARYYYTLHSLYHIQGSYQQAMSVQAFQSVHDLHSDFDISVQQHPEMFLA